MSLAPGATPGSSKTSGWGKLKVLLPAAERGQKGTPTWHHSNAFLPSFRMNDKVRAQFAELGSSHVNNVGFRDNWVFLGAKGLKNKSPFEEVCGPLLTPAPEDPILFIARPEPHHLPPCRRCGAVVLFPHVEPSCKFCHAANLTPTSSFIISLSFFFFPWST